uniref:Uncharacterized protein n=1 Tax=Clytia hemisphaerica TaxID=252671 RepID=A0A7M5XBD8_9CNID
MQFVGDLISNFSNIDNWPSSHTTAISLLKGEGLYFNPFHHRICYSKENHPIHIYVVGAEGTCPECDTLPTVNRYYLPIKDKMKRWFLSNDTTHKMLGHWQNKDAWLGKDGVTYPIDEIWDGYRFKQLQWFWDPNSRWPLPHMCSNCQNFINLMDIGIQSDDETEVNVDCYHCDHRQTIQPKFASGDPRNLGFIGHWDGWSPNFGRGTSRSTGSIEISVANMEKRYRCQNEYVYTSTFVPEHSMPNKEPNALDPFLEPLVDELVELFNEGVEVQYPIDVGDLKAGKAKIRCMLICWIGDYPAQCQIGKFSCKGTYGCRVDKCKGESVNDGSTKYYINNRHYFTNRWEKRNYEIEINTMEEIEQQPSVYAKLRRAKETGYTGLSVLTRLNCLYGFNVLQDLVHDVMHLVALNLCRKLYKRIFQNESFDLGHFQSKLQEFPFTSEMLDGHCPKNPIKHSSWTAEEWKTFSYPVAELVLADSNLDAVEYHLVWLTARIVELLFHHRAGLKRHEVETLNKICWRRLIFLEEEIGKEQCVITAHNSLHIGENLERFGHCDNTWCWGPERVVKRYKDIPTNFKNIEASYAKQEIKREILAIEKKNRRITHKTDRVNEIVSSLEGAKMLCCNGDNNPVVVFIGSTSVTNVKIVDQALQETLDFLDIGVFAVYQWFRSCYLSTQQSHLKIGCFIMFRDGIIGKIKEFIFVKNEHASVKLIRVEKFEFDDLRVREIKTVQPTGQEDIKLANDVLRKVIVYTLNAYMLFSDFDRPSFEFNYEVL